MQDHYKHRENWLKTLESWNKPKKVINEACTPKKTKKKANEEAGAGGVGASGGATTTGDITAPAAEGSNYPAGRPERLGKKKKLQTRNCPENVTKESIRRTLDKAYHNSLYAESIAVGEDEEELMGTPDDIEDMDDSEYSDEIGSDEFTGDLPVDDMGAGVDDLSTDLGNDLEDVGDEDILQLHDPEMGMEPEMGGEDINVKLDRIEGMLQQLVGEEVPEELPVDDTMSVVPEEPVGVEMEVEPLDDVDIEDTELPPVEGEDELEEIKDQEFSDPSDPESFYRESAMSDLNVVAQEVYELLKPFAGQTGKLKAIISNVKDFLRGDNGDDNRQVPVHDIEDLRRGAFESKLREGVMSDLDIVAQEVYELLKPYVGKEGQLNAIMSGVKNYIQNPPESEEPESANPYSRMPQSTYRGPVKTATESKKSWGNKFFESTTDLRLPIIESLLRDE